MTHAWAVFPPDATPDVIAASAILATVGWLYSARRARSLSRKQHTINIIVTQAFDAPMREAQSKLASAFKNHGTSLPLPGSPEHAALLPYLRLVLNHFEFIAAGIRRGDIDEMLVWDAQRGTIIALCNRAEKHIFSLRDTRARRSMYEHLEWLVRRWDGKRPNLAQRICERCLARPFVGTRVNPRA